MQQPSEAKRERNLPQFSVRDLLVLMFVVSGALTIAVLSRGSRYFAVFASPWTWVALAFIVVAWRVGSSQAIAVRRLVIASIVMYFVSLAMPALGFDDEFEWGFAAWLQSYVFGYGYVLELIFPPKPPPIQFFSVDIGHALPIACVIGAVANTLLIFGWLARVVAHRRRRPPSWAHWMAKTSFCLMLLSVVPIQLQLERNGLDALYPGFGLWAASALLLVLATDARSADGEAISAVRR